MISLSAFVTQAFVTRGFLIVLIIYESYSSTKKVLIQWIENE